MTPITGAAAARVFLVFAFAYFLSALLRAITATLAPVFSRELALGAGDLGLLAGAYFLGFALMQLPLGQALDRWGPRRTQAVLMTLAVAGCIAFARAQTLAALLASRVLIGMGVAACLMAPLTCYRLRFSAPMQLRANAWMLMTGSLGMVASTLPVQWALPLLGWRGLFVALALMLAAAIVLVAWLAPPDRAARGTASKVGAGAGAGYAEIARHPLFLRLAPLAVLQYGGLIAVQALWAGPWLTEVAGWTAAQAAGGLFAINLAMLLAFLAWGALMPRLASRGLDPMRVVALGMPVVLGLLAWTVAGGASSAAAHWAAWCVASTCISLTQPALAQVFPDTLAGRALSAYNLLIFAGVFAVQWALGLAIDGLRAAGWETAAAFQGALGGFGLLCLLAYLWFLRRA
ncbi:MAG: MFS transporter [Burkholderiales bacterium]|nr:MFS transporter [Burkholderiales bacterium]